MEDQGTLWLPEALSTHAAEIDSVFNFVNIVSGIIFAGVVVAIVYLAWRYRRQRPDERPVPVEENKILEAAWVVVPTLLVLITFLWGFRGYMRANISPPDSYVINVQGAQWVWTYTYPTGAVSTDELHVPVGRPVRLQMSSRDVLHSMYIPVFRVKQDVLPNRYSSLWFQATKPGTYDLFCTEYCGTLHSGMIGRVVVHEQEDFERWLTENATPTDLPPAELGALLYKQQACAGCHSLDGTAGVGPSFQGLWQKTEQLADGGTVLVDENYLRESILQPDAQIVAGYPPVMPDSYNNLSEAQITALVEFIKTVQ